MTIKECKEWLSRARKTDEEINALIAEQERALTNATSSPPNVYGANGFSPATENAPSIGSTPTSPAKAEAA